MPGPLAAANGPDYFFYCDGNCAAWKGCYACFARRLQEAIVEEYVLIPGAGIEDDKAVTKKPRLDLVPPEATYFAARAFEAGAAKGYGPWSFRHKKANETAQEWALRYLAALERHMLHLKSAVRLGGSPLDPDSGLHEICALAANVAILAHGLLRDGMVTEEGK